MPKRQNLIGQTFGRLTVLSKDIEASKAIIQFYLDAGCDEDDDISDS